MEEESDWNRGLELARDNSWNAIVVPTICDGVLLGKVMAQAIASRPDRDLTALVVYEARNGAVSEQGPQALASGADAFVTRGGCRPWSARSSACSSSGASSGG
ncbi:MAG: hypothetical protein R3F17_08325 [Planctomycetota bacterium]